MAMGTWEGVGTITGGWLGMSIWAAGAIPVGMTDGPLPFMDAAWMAANYKNTQRLAKGGGEIGKGLDAYLADDPVVEAFVRIPPEFDVKTPTNNPTEFVFNNLPEGSGIKMSMGSFLDFSNLFPTSFDMTNYSPEQAQTLALTMAPQFFMFPTAMRESKWPAWN